MCLQIHVQIRPVFVDLVTFCFVAIILEWYLDMQ